MDFPADWWTTCNNNCPGEAFHPPFVLKEKPIGTVESQSPNQRCQRLNRTQEEYRVSLTCIILPSSPVNTSTPIASFSNKHVVLAHLSATHPSHPSFNAHSQPHQRRRGTCSPICYSPVPSFLHHLSTLQRP